MKPAATAPGQHTASSHSPKHPPAAPVTKRGDRARCAILSALCELLDERALVDISVQHITDRAGVTRTGFYYYFDSKNAALAAALHDDIIDDEYVARRILPRRTGESPARLVDRIITTVSHILGRDDPVWTAGRRAQHGDLALREAIAAVETAVVKRIVEVLGEEISRGARPISTDRAALVRTLTAATAMIACGDSTFVGRARDPQRARHAMKAIWLRALWPEHVAAHI